MSDSNQLPAYPEQQLLFDELQFFVAGDKEAGERYYRHTGRRISPEDAEAIVRRRCLGMSERAVAESFRVSTHTVGAIMMRFEEDGKLAALKSRLSRKLGLALDLASDELVERLRNGKIPDNVLPVLFGILFDKKSLLDGDPTVRVEERVEISLSPQDIRSMLDRMKQAAGVGKVIDVEPVKVSASDCQSDGSKPA